MSRATRFLGSSTLAGLLVGLVFARVAHAQPASVEEHAAERVELDYWGSADCPSKASFVREVTARIRRPVAWVVMDGGVHIALSLTHAEGGATGRLEVARSGTPPARREFTAATCSEVGSALALVVALSLDPNARTEPLAEPEPEPARPVEEAAPAPVPIPEAPPPAPPAPSVTPPSPSPVPSSAPPGAPLRYVAWLGASGGVNAGYAPEALVTLGVSLGARFDWGSWFSPTLQLTPLWGKTGTTGPSADLSRFAWAMARLEACPVEVRLTAALAFSPCLAGELGRLSARGAADGVASTAADRWWAAAGVTAALRGELGRWFVRLSVEAMVPATRDEFVFRDPERSVHRADAFAYGGRLGLGFRFGP